MSLVITYFIIGFIFFYGMYTERHKQMPKMSGVALLWYSVAGAMLWPYVIWINCYKQ